jgi:hypothetical protein
MQTDGVLVTGARAPVAVHWAWALRASGYRVHLGDVQRYPLGNARGLSEGYLRFAAPGHDFAGFRRDVLALCARYRITTIVPTCEEVFWLAAMIDDLAQAGIALFAPPTAILRAVHDKAAFITLCHDFWPHLPRTRQLITADDLRAELPEAGRLVFKPVFSRFATRTLICPTAARAATIQPTPADPWVAQEFVPGREICAYAIATQGQVRALAVYHPRHRAGLGAGIYFDPVDPEPALAFVRAFCAATQWTGQVSFDLIEGAGGLYPIECNPRATSGLHLIRDAGGLTEAIFAAPDPLLIGADVGAQCVKLAMWLYAGWPHRRQMPAFRADLARATEALRWADGSRIGLAGQMRAVLEIAGLALRRGQSLQQAATADIEWNGPGQH